MDFLLGFDEFRYILSKVSTIITLMVVVVIVIAIIVLMLDMFKAVISGDHDATKKALNIAKKRLITLALFLLLPSFVNFGVNIVSTEETIDYSSAVDGEEITSAEGESYGDYEILDGYINFSAYIKVDE
ncbi:MAG: hypothetical protein IJ018_02330 [Bacilli bacterium]|nr:hypothetical protein [Bacilli bacterium]